MDEDTHRRIERFVALIGAWGRSTDLVAPGDVSRLRERHVDDSLRLLPLVRSLPAGPCADVGSGAGFPGVPLALADPGRTWRLIEPRRRRAAFLEEVVRSLDLDAEVIVATGQQAARDPHLRGAHALAVARAVAPPGAALALLRPLVASGGVAAVFLGARAPVPPEAEEWDRGVAIMRVGSAPLQGDR